MQASGKLAPLDLGRIVVQVMEAVEHLPRSRALRVLAAAAIMLGHDTAAADLLDAAARAEREGEGEPDAG